MEVRGEMQTGPFSVAADAPRRAKPGAVGCVEIRPYRPEDAAAVREVHLEAFEGREEEPRLVDLLHAAGAAPISLVAAEESGGRILGHVLFSPVDLDGRSEGLNLLGLAPVGVLPEEQGRGLGSRLIRAGLAACLAARYDAVVVLGGRITTPGSASLGRAIWALATSSARTSTSWSWN